MVAEISPSQDIENKIEILAVLEGKVHVNEIGVAEMFKQVFLVHNGVDTPLRDDPSVRRERLTWL